MVKKKKVTEKKSIAIVGEGLTEREYFDSLRIYEKYRFTIKPSLPENTDIKNMAQTALTLLNKGFDYVYCLIDMDKIESNPTEKKNYENVINDEKYQGISWIHSYPCTEFWFLLHSLKLGEVRRYKNCDEVLKELREYMPGYDKTKKYFKGHNLYNLLKSEGSMDKAIESAKKLEKLRKKEDGIDYSEIYKVIEMIQKLKAESEK